MCTSQRDIPLELAQTVIRGRFLTQTKLVAQHAQRRKGLLEAHQGIGILNELFLLAPPEAHHRASG
jgi:hypothetical protein